MYGGTTGIDDDDVDMPRTGIDGVLNQLLDDGGRSLDDLSRRYLVGNGIGEELDDVTHDFFFLRLLAWGFSSVPAFLGRQTKMSSLERGRT